MRYCVGVEEEEGVSLEERIFHIGSEVLAWTSSFLVVGLNVSL